MRKFLLLISIVAASMFSTAIAAVGDVTTIVDQTFTGSPTLTNTSAYTWGSDMIVRNADGSNGGLIVQNFATNQGLTVSGLYMSNFNDTGKNYEDKDFMTFNNSLGNSTTELDIEYPVLLSRGKGQANTSTDINFFNAEGVFVFGIQEISGNSWAYVSNIVTANADGTKTTTTLPTAHIGDKTGSTVKLTVKFSGDNAKIDIDGGSYSAYTSHEGIKAIKLTVSGGPDQNRGLCVEKFLLKTIEAEAAQFADYTVKFTDGSNEIKESSTRSGEVGSAISLLPNDIADFFNDDKTIKYIYVSNDADGKTVAANGSTVVTVTFRQANKYSYTVKNDVNDDIVASGDCFEGESATIPYHRYIVKSDGSIWLKEPCGGAKNLEYNYTFTPSTNGHTEVLSYSEVTDKGKVVWFAEAEDLADEKNPYYVEGMYATNKNNANVRCSNSYGAYADQSVDLYTLQPGTYKITIAGMGGNNTDDSKNVDFIVSAGDKTFTMRTNGSWFEKTFEEFTLNEKTKVSFEGANGSHQFDYILITGTVDVTGIAINGTDNQKIENIELSKDGNYQLNAVITPAEASNKAVNWSSSDATIATVDENGKVTAVSGGTATITATSAANAEIKASVTVNVKVPATGLEVQDKDGKKLENNAELKLTAGDVYTLKAVVAPEGSTDVVTWTSSKPEVATVADGVVTTISAGATTITAKVAGFTVAVNVTVAEATVAVTGVTLDKTETAMKTGETLTLTATIAPTDASVKTVAWKSSDEATATVKDGLVTALKKGEVTITASAGGKEATCKITITDIEVAGISLNVNELNIPVGQTATLEATVDPENATDKTVKWTSSNAEIATVDADGKVTAVAAGKATITATAGEKSATCTVNVIVPVTGIALNFDGVTVETGDEFTIGYTISPEDATDKTVTWTSSDAAIATVDTDGKVTAKGVGEAVITAKAGEQSASCTVTVVAPAVAEEGAAIVRMTYVNMNEPNKAYGIIKAGETARTGFNNISGGSVGFANTGYGVNYITYLQVDASAIKDKFITKATLTFEGSGSADSKRTTGWGVGYNSSVWSSTMTNESADKSITTMGDVLYGTSKSATKFESYSFDITEAINNAEGRIATILVYETSAGGGYIKNPVVKIESTNEEVYNVTFTEKNEVDGVKVVVNDQDVTKGTSLTNGTYSFTATAPHYKDYTGEFTVAGEDLNVEFTMTQKESWKFTVKNNVNDKVKYGTTFAGESASIAYPRYILAADGTVWEKYPGKNTPYTASFTPTSNNEVFTLEYKATEITDGILFVEAENLEGVTKDTGSPASVRSSSAAGAIAAEAVAVTTLNAGTYKVNAAVVGNTGASFTIKAGEETVLTIATEGYWLDKTSDEFTLKETTVLTFKGGSTSKSLDYILITGKIAVTGLSILDEEDNVLDSTHSLALFTGDEYTLTEVVSPENATEQRVTWTSSDESVAKIVDIVEEPHQVHIDAIGPGEATITATLDGFSTSFKVTVSNAEVPVTGIKLDKTTAEMYTGETLQLTATITPQEATSKEVKWTSSDNTIATVSAKGVVTAKKAGKVTITATANKLTATCEITISDIEVVEITLNQTTANVEVGKTIELTATVVPANATNAEVNWSTDNEKIATVDENGVVKGLAVGTATITAHAGDKTADCVVTVSKTSAAELIGFDPEADVKVFDLNGIYVGDTMEGLQQGTYIVRQGNNVKKVRIR